jgi:glycerophosphoryl diester phosphodiesterase
MPSSPSRQARLRSLIAKPFAHRGLHGGGRIENSRAAFEAAIATGHGIELDVQASADGRAIVFHDSRLDRLAGLPGPVCGLVAAELKRIRLKDSAETIPSLAEILELIAGSAPLLIELKAPKRDVRLLCRAVAADLAGYDGPVAVMSFNPEVGRWFERHHPDVLRGLVVTENGKPSRGRLKRRLARWWSNPDFLAYDIRDLPSVSAKGLPVLTWTVRSRDDRARAARHADQIIYENLAG